MSEPRDVHTAGGSEPQIAPDPVEELFEHLDRQAQALRLTGEPSLALRIEETASKALLLAAASRFEVELVQIVADLARTTSASRAVAEFCVNQGLYRRYHTLFAWDAHNANKFFGLFGEEVLQAARSRATADAEFNEAVRAFLKIGAKRNELVHEDFVSFPLSDTLNELIALYRLARRFLTCARELLGGPEPSGT